MAAMTTALTEFADNGNSRTYTLAGHTASSPRLVLQKRRVASGKATTAESTVDVLYATTDTDGVILPQKIAFDVSVLYPIAGDSADIAAALAIFRDIVNGDEFANMITTQEWLS